MATKILIKKSSTSGGIPLAADLDQGELAVNLADRKIYTKDNSNAIVRLDSAYVGATAPANAAKGDLWYDTTNDLLKAYNGTSFASAGYQTIAALEDTTITSVASGEVLKYDGSKWINNTLAEAGIQPAGSYSLVGHTHAASDITSGTFANARISQSNVTQHQAALSITESQISDLQTYLTDITGEQTGDLSDVTITNISAGEVLKWSGTAWVNNTLAEAGVAAASHTHAASAITSGTFADARIAQSNVTQHQAALSITESQISDLGNYITDVSGDNLETLSNVTVTSNTSGEILKWNGSAWINNTLAEAGIQPAGAYLTTESDTLATVTSRGASTGAAVTITNATTSTSDTTGALKVTGGVGIQENLSVGGNAVIDGNLTVKGTTTSVNSNEVNIGDAIILLNSDETAAPTQNGGIEIERGTSANVSFVWDETSDVWSLGNETLADVVIDGGTF